jgi:CubicO group peptidase (beta-lactamase class C family)
MTVGIITSLPMAGLAGTESLVAENLQRFVDSGAMAGAVVVIADKNTVLAEGAVGYADIAGKVPMKMDDLFWIASMSKPMTAAAFMMLVDEGKVSVDDQVSKYLPEFANTHLGAPAGEGTTARPILIRDLLSHTSGLPFAAPSESPTLDRLSLAQRTADYGKLALQSAPGEKYAYSNAGINTVGRLIEVISGMPYEQFMSKRMFEPLGMKDTVFVPAAEQLKKLPKSYRVSPDGRSLTESSIGQLSYPLNDPSRTPMPAGGLFSTAGDTTKFCQMIAADGMAEGRQLISPESIREMTKRQTPAELSENYGFGWAIWGNSYLHGGAFKTSMGVSKDTGVITVFLVHQDGPWGADGDAIPQALEAIAKIARADAP